VQFDNRCAQWCWLSLTTCGQCERVLRCLLCRRTLRGVHVLLGQHDVCAQGVCRWFGNVSVQSNLLALLAGPAKLRHSGWCSHRAPAMQLQLLLLMYVAAWCCCMWLLMLSNNADRTIAHSASSTYDHSTLVRALRWPQARWRSERDDVAEGAHDRSGCPWSSVPRRVGWWVLPPPWWWPRPDTAICDLHAGRWLVHLAIELPEPHDSWWWAAWELTLMG